MIDWVAIQTAIREWARGGTQLALEKVVWGAQDGPRPEGVAVVLLVTNISETASWKEEREKYLEFTTVSVSGVNATANTLTCSAHPLQTGDGPVLVESTGTLPAGVPSSGRVWIIRDDANTVRLAATFWDAMASTPVAIDLTSAGSGAITIAATGETRRVGEEMESVSCGYVRLTVELRCHSASKITGAIGVGPQTAMAVLNRVRERRRLPSQEAILEDVNISVTNIDRVRFVGGTRDTALVEPRAYLDVHISVPFEEAEGMPVIERAVITSLMNGNVTTVSRP